MDLRLFFSIFIAIFIAELPDKTAFATLLLAARGRAGAIFCGVAAAFLVQTIVAVAFGRVIALAPERWVHLGAGLMFIGFAIYTWVTRLDDEDDDETLALKSGFWRSAWQAFVVIFIAEWGDLTQIATATFVAQYPKNIATVFAASLSALWVVTGLAVLIGQKGAKMINPAKIRRFSGVLFILIGFYFIYKSAVGI